MQGMRATRKEPSFGRLLPLFFVSCCITSALLAYVSYQAEDHGLYTGYTLHQSGDEFSCDIVNLPLGTNYCQFIKTNCNSDYFWIAERYYCSQATSKYPSTPLLVLILLVIFVMLVVLFVSLSILVAKFLYPILHSVCIKYHINEKFLSCILVPFINCFPDIVNYYIAMRLNSIDLTLGQVIGSILIIFTLVLGSISFLQPFVIADNKKLLINDFVSVFVVILIFLYIVSDGVITPTECVIMVMIYVLYVVYLYLIIDKVKFEQDEEEAIPDTQEHLHSNSNLLSVPSNMLSVPSFGIEDALSLISDDMETSEQARSVNYGTFDHENMDSNYHETTRVEDDDGDRELFHGLTNKTVGLSTSELSLRSSIWDDSRHYLVGVMKHWALRVLQVFFNLIDLSFYLIIPFIEDEEPELGEVVTGEHTSAWINWRKSLFPTFFHRYVSNLRCLVIPMLLKAEYFPDLPEKYLVLAVLIFIAWNNTPLLSHTPTLIVKIFAILMTLVVISVLARIILQMLKNLGVILEISETLLGLTIFAISNSINDIITNVTLANMGKPILGVNACLGTPLLSILLGIGFNGLIIIFQKGIPNLQLDVNLHIIITTIGLVAVLAFYLVYIPLNGWKFDRKLGVFVVCWWVIITIVNCILH